ncbi:MAG TPA: hypothetical protein VHW23_02215 [Kofleriaceae bacterium]|jgi:hypothetical protein|nr:hypothetical protein [Kofleriaceae bacterium]
MSVTASCGTSSDGPTPPDAGLFSDAGSQAPAVFVPIHLTQDALIAGAPDLTVTDNPTTIDTTALTIDGTTSPYFVQRDGYAVLFANRAVVDHDVAITGARPLIVVADGDVTVTARIDLGAHGSVAGPGAATSGSGVGGPGSTFMSGEERASSGGGGGGHGSPGGAGGPSETPGGTAGMVYGAQPSDSLIGGSPGGLGGNAVSGGGAGGGALQISSATSISITGPHIAAGGGGGHGEGGTSDGGSGGGAGGELLFEAPAITIASTIAANGGGGGGGGGGGTQGGTDGADGLIGDAPAPGGVGGVPQGSDGGNGAAGTTASFVDAQPGASNNSKAGGGGGGAGRIWLRYEAATPPTTAGAVISPPAQLDPTLP